MPRRVPRRDRGARTSRARSRSCSRCRARSKSRCTCNCSPRPGATPRSSRRASWSTAASTAMIRRRHRDQGADGRAVAHRGAGVLGGADAAAIPRERRRISISSASISPPRASRSRKPAPTRCTAWNGCAARSRRGSCSWRSRLGWVEPTGRANARPMMNSAIPITSSRAMMGFAALNPSYERVHRAPKAPQSVDCHFRRRAYKLGGGRRHARGDGRPRRSCSKDTIPISSRSRW